MARHARQGAYRDVLGVREFRAIVLCDGLSILGDQVARLAVALLVFERTGSAFAASATYACSFLTWLVGGPFLSVAADRYPRRTVMLVCDLVRMALVGVLAIPDLSLVVVFGVLLLVGVLAPPFESARSAVLPDILEGERYIVGNAVTNTVSQAGQVLGFLGGGALVAVLGTSGALAVDAVTFALSAAVVAVYVQRRPAAIEAGERGSVLSETAAGLRLVTGDRYLFRLLAYGLVGVAVLIVPEGLAVSVAAETGGGEFAAGALTAAVPFGFLIGTAVVLRVPDARRQELLPLLVAVGSLPLLLSPLLDSWWLVLVVWVVAGTGSSLQLVANAAFVAAVAPAVRGRAFGLAGTALMATQGAALLLAGALAEQTGSREAVAVAGVIGLAFLPLLLRLSASGLVAAQASGGTGRGSRG